MISPWCSVSMVIMETVTCILHGHKMHLRMVELHFHVLPEHYTAYTLSLDVVDSGIHLTILRSCVSKQACRNGRALLEALGLSGRQIDSCFYKHERNDEESVHAGLRAWISTGTNTTWKDLLTAMEFVGIAVQERERLKKVLYDSAGVSMRYSVITHV